MKSAKIFLLLGCFTLISQLLLPPVSLAKLYTWTDRNGIVRRTYYPPPTDQVMQKGAAQQRPAKQQPVRKNTVELYVTSWCPYCKQAIHFFQSRGIAYRVYDIEKDKNAAARKQELDRQGGGVPFAVVNGTRIHGYSPEQYANALNN